MSLSDALGQTEAARLFLQAVVNQRIPHAYVFLGPDGVGKALLARQAAKLLLCKSAVPRGDGDARLDACDACSACRLVDRDTHPDLHLVQPEEGKRLLRLDQVHQLRRQLSLTPVQGGWRVCILREADRMTEEAANALLKTIEEPPAQSLLIMIASQREALLPTIISRCQILRFRPLSPGHISRILKARSDASEADVRFAAHCADGSAGRAMALLAGNGMEKRDWIISRVRGLDPERPLDFSTELHAMAMTAGKALEDRRACMRQMLDLLLFYYRDILLAQLGASDVSLYNTDLRDQIERHSRTIAQTALVRLITEVMIAQNRINQNANLPLALHNLAIQVAAAGAREAA